MSAVETLRDAAKVLRERAEVETILRDGDPYYEVTYMPDGTPITEMGAFERVLTPGVALALADWLDKAADGDGRMPHRFPEGAPSEVVSWACGECATVIREAYGPTTTCPVDWRPRDPHALRVAEAILGGTS